MKKQRETKFPRKISRSISNIVNYMVDEEVKAIKAGIKLAIKEFENDPRIR